MQTYQKHRIGMLRGNGATYAEVAAELGLSESTVKSHCRRNNISAAFVFCPECGVQLEHTPKRKRKRFCSDKCRLAWWAKNPDALNRRAVYCFVCPCCGEHFTAYGNAKRKYCSLACAATGRGQSCT